MYKTYSALSVVRARRKHGTFSNGTRNARIQHDRARDLSIRVMKIPGCIDMHLQDSDCARRALNVHFARFQDFPAESRKSEFFTIARTITVSTPPPSQPYPSASSLLTRLERDGIHFAGAIFRDKFWHRLSLFFAGEFAIRKLFSGFSGWKIRIWSTRCWKSLSHF